MTPYEKLALLLQEENCLRPGITLEKLGAIASQMSDNEFAERMVKARFDIIDKRIGSVPVFIPEAALPFDRLKANCRSQNSRSLFSELLAFSMPLCCTYLGVSRLT